MAEDFRIQVEADLDTSAITKQLADSFNISDKSVLKNLNKQLNSSNTEICLMMEISKSSYYRELENIRQMLVDGKF